jgi:uncharacterized membrane protein
VAVSAFRNYRERYRTALLDTLKGLDAIHPHMVHRRDVATLGIAALAGAASVVAAPELPAEVAIHFDASGQPDDYASRTLALVLVPALAAGIALLFAVIPTIDPLGENVAKFQTAYDATAVATVAFLAYVHGLLLAYNAGVEFHLVQALAPAMAGLYYVVGLLLERAEQSWFVGIRNPWTLSDETVWRDTHDRAAPLFKASAGVALLGVLVPDYGIWLATAPVVAVALGATVYSFVAYRRREDGHA